jgi:hypothetical protein
MGLLLIPLVVLFAWLMAGYAHSYLPPPNTKACPMQFCGSGSGQIGSIFPDRDQDQHPRLARSESGSLFISTTKCKDKLFFVQ